jgi:hypothetical protein
MTYLAARLRSIADNPDYFTLAQIPEIASQVERLERFIDQLANEAPTDPLLPHQVPVQTRPRP